MRAQQSGNNNKAPLPSQEETPNEVTILQVGLAWGGVLDASSTHTSLQQGMA